MTEPEGTPPLPDHRRPQAPPNHAPAEGEGPPEPAGARYALAIPTPSRRDRSEPERGHERSDKTGRGPTSKRAVATEVAVRKRTYRSARRDRIVMLRYDESEYDVVSRAAADAGLTMSGYAALAALAAARCEAPPTLMPLRGALAEVMTARTQVRRYAVNVNQAVAVLYMTGEPPNWFRDALAITTRAVANLDLAAAQLVRLLR